MRKKLIIIIVGMLLLISLSLYYTYAMDVSIEETTGNADLTYNIDIKDTDGRTITIGAGETKYFDMFITNTNDCTINYGLAYSGEENEGITIAQLDTSKNKVSELIEANATNQISLIIINNTEEQLTYNILPITGYEKGGNLIVPEGYTLISSTYSFPNSPDLIEGLIPITYKTEQKTLSCGSVSNPTYESNPECYEIPTYDLTNLNYFSKTVLAFTCYAYDGMSDYDGCMEELEYFLADPYDYYGFYDSFADWVTATNVYINDYYQGYSDFLDQFYSFLVDETDTYTTYTNGEVFNIDVSYNPYDDGYLSYLSLLTQTDYEILIDVKDHEYIDTLILQSIDYSIIGLLQDTVGNFDSKIEYARQVVISEMGYNTISGGDISDSCTMYLPGCCDEASLIDEYLALGWYGGAELVLNFNSSPTSKTTVTSILKADSANTDNSWYNYDNKQWANAVLVSDTNRSTYKSASVGTEITEDDILAYYVWIPRYKYKVWNITKTEGTDSYDAQTNGIDIVWESGTETTGTVTCNDYNFSITNGSLSEICSGVNGRYYTHPAFTFGNTELRGLWISKFEISSSSPTTSNGGGNSTSLTVRSKPNVNSWRYNYVTNFSYVIQNMSIENNEYGLKTDSNSHMLKNQEWGAVAYLTHSGYGRCSGDGCEEVALNSYSSYMTGCGPQSKDSNSSGSICNVYNTELGQLASTTGNIYGVYDMSGGAVEYVMGNMSSAAGSYTYYASGGGSNFTYTDDTAKYIDTYANGSININQTAYNRARLGDATGEVAKSSGRGWNNDYAGFVNSNHSWFIRGNHYSSGSEAGVFDSGANNGYYNSYYSARACLVGGT